MSLDGLQRETVGEGDHVTDELLAQTYADLSNLGTQIEQIAATKGQAVADSIEVTPQLEADVEEFIRASVNNELGEYTGEFNAETFDTDGEDGLDKFEFEQFSQSLDAAIDQIILLDGLGVFEEVHEEAGTTSLLNIWDADRNIAKSFNFITDKIILDSVFGDEKNGSLAERVLNGFNVSDEELQAMKDKPFAITSAESWQELTTLLALELGEGIEDVLRFIGNIPGAAVLIPRYTTLRVQANSDDPKEAAEAEIKLAELTDNNPALALLDLLGEKGLEVIQSMASMMTSGKQGDIALAAVSIAGLLAGGAGAVKLGARMGKMSKLEKAAARVQRGAEKVDDLVGGAGIGHMTGQFKASKTPRASNNSGGPEASAAEARKQASIAERVATEAESSVARTGTDNLGVEPRFEPAVMQRNAELSPIARQSEASKVLGRELTPAQSRAILAAHELGADGVGEYSGRELVSKRQILTEAGFTKAEANLLMDKALAGDSDRLRAQPKENPWQKLIEFEAEAFKTEGVSLHVYGTYRGLNSHFYKVIGADSKWKRKASNAPDLRALNSHNLKMILPIILLEEGPNGSLTVKFIVETQDYVKRNGFKAFEMTLPTKALAQKFDSLSDEEIVKFMTVNWRHVGEGFQNKAGIENRLKEMNQENPTNLPPGRVKVEWLN